MATWLIFHKNKPNEVANDVNAAVDDDQDDDDDDSNLL